MNVELKQEPNRVKIQLNGYDIGSARALADKRDPVIAITHVIRLTELEEVVRQLREAADNS